MKKLIALILALAMVLPMAACGQAKPAAPAAPATPASSVAPVSSAAPAAPEKEATGEKETKEKDIYELDFSPANANGEIIRDNRGAKGENGAVASGNVEASRAGLEIIEAGGNAVDAAVAISFALGVVEPMASGIGGGGFMNIHLADGTSIFLDGREIAPLAATPDLWPTDSEGKVINSVKTQGGTSVCTPTLVATLLHALENYGTMSREQVMAPAIRLAEEGYITTPDFVNYSGSSISKMTTLNGGEAAKVFLAPGNFPYELGVKIKNPDLANTLRIIADKGLEGFYKGDVAEKIVAAVKESGGVMEMADLDLVMTQQPIVRTPAYNTYRGYQIISAPPVSSGGTHIIEMLNILENIDMSKYDVNSSEYMHVLSEIFKMAFADRAKYMGDPAFAEGGLPLAGLQSKEYAKSLFEKIDMEKAKAHEAGDPWKFDDTPYKSGAMTYEGAVIGVNTPDTYESDETTHISVGDKEGNMVSMTQTLNGAFGSCVVPTGCGFSLNNNCSDFGIGWGLPNSVEGGKKPLSSMSPSFVLNPDGTPFLIIGSPGATRIFPSVLQCIVKAIDYDMGCEEMVLSPRIWDNNNGVVHCEGRIDQKEIDELAAMGHETTVLNEWDNYFGSVSAVMYGDDGMIYGMSDPRRDGKALAY